MMRKQSNSFKEFKTQEYFKAIAESILGVRRAINSDFAKNTFVDELAKWIAKSNASIYEVPDTIFDKFAEKNVSDITNKYFAKVQVEFGKVLTTNFESMIKLALRHQMYDYLYEYGDDDIRKYFDSVVILEDTKELAAEFAPAPKSYEEENKNKIRYSLTRNAVNNLLKQRAEQTNINDVAKIQERVKIADEVSRNVYMLNKISDSTNAGKAAMMNFLYGNNDEKQNFISSNYLGKRRRVLQASYSAESNANIRKAVALFLADNREYITIIKSQRNKYEYDLNLLKIRIRNIINKDEAGLQGAFKQQSPDVIVKTELNIAYNFGKVAAFGGKADRYKRFRWNVDREYALISRYKRLASGSKRTDPVPCEDCELQDGLEYYLFEIIENQRDAGDVINYKKGGGTVWRNHSKPSAPFHPNCFIQGTQVRMFNPIANVVYNKNIEDVVVGDFVSVPTSEKYKPVIQTHKNWHDEPIYKIKSESGQTIIATGNHPLWDGTNWKDARHLSIGDNLYLQINKDKRGDATSLQARLYSRRLDKTSQRSRSKESLSNYSEKITGLTQNTSRSTAQKKSELGTPQTQFKQNDSQQPFTKSRDSSKDNGFERKESGKRRGIFVLQLQRSKNQIQRRYARGFGAFYSEFLGDECSQNFETSKNRLRVRANIQVGRWSVFSPRFLSKELGRLYRGKGKMAWRCKAKIGALAKTIQHQQPSANSGGGLQGFEKSFQGLRGTRIVSIEVINEPQYVYNISVQDIPVYFANGLLSHNCQCFWSLSEDIDEEDFDPKKQPPNRPPQGGLGTPIKIAIAATAFVAGLALLASNKSLGNATAKAIYSTFTTPRLPPPSAANLPRIVESGLEALNFVGAEKNIVSKVAKSVQSITRV